MAAAGTEPAPEPKPLPEPMLFEEGVLHFYRHREVSGLAPSRRSSKVLWAINDSGSSAAIQAVDPSGKDLGSLRLQGIRNRDWEDLASFEYKGKPYLAVGEIGDNKPKWSTCSIYIVEEPKLIKGRVPRTRAQVAWEVEFRYPNGPRNAEAMAVDVKGGHIYLITKFELPKQLYRIPLHPPAGDGEDTPVVVAERLGPVKVPSQVRELKGFRQWKEALQGLLVTAMDYDEATHRLALLTYDRVLVYQGRPDEPWLVTLRRLPMELELPPAPQYEAMCFSRYGRNLYVASEAKRREEPSHLLRVELVEDEPADPPKKKKPAGKK